MRCTTQRFHSELALAVDGLLGREERVVLHVVLKDGLPPRRLRLLLLPPAGLVLIGSTVLMLVTSLSMLLLLRLCVLALLHGLLFVRLLVWFLVWFAGLSIGLMVLYG